MMLIRDNRFWLHVLAVTLLFITLVLLVPASALTLEFKREAYKADWLKDLFKDKEVEPEDVKDIIRL